ncbi:MAG TPA: prephenate dehydrogenase/arogenate dehydrogenase family protein [Candidatus Methylomirabilis sp.]|nr:prephenate dehydrogenase/arogenate dehydrogenase family protein [Candidatus Methylomirabilis sp.]
MARGRRGKGAAPLFRRMAVVGVGLIGGSLAAACRKRGLVETLVGFDADGGALQEALALGLVDEAARDAAAAAAGADVVVLAAPVGALEALAAAIAPALAPAALVTDVGSVKGDLVRRLEARLPAGRYVPAHPIAGRERSGPAAASATLFEDARCVLTPTPRTDRQALARIRRLWEGVGAVVELMDPEEHDDIFAAVSHLPHAVAYALMNAMLDLQADGRDVLPYSAGGLRDFTRVAASDPTMWRDIFLANRPALLDALRRFRAALARLEAALAAGDDAALWAECDRARRVRRDLL